MKQRKKRGDRQMKKLVLGCLKRAFGFMFTVTAVFGSGYCDLPVMAEEAGSITINFPVEGSSVSLYHVGSYDNGYVLEEPFSSYQVDLKTEEAASTLYGYIQRDKIEADMETSISEDKKAVFSDLSEGAYLISGIEGESDGKKYTSSPLFVVLPQKDSSGNISKDITISEKYEEKELPENIDLYVMKIWDDDNSEKRPQSIMVELLKDDEVYDTVTLDDSVNWKKEWNDLDSSYAWRVVEKDVPADYVVTVSKDGDGFVITNSYKPDKPNHPDRPNLPHTGQLWWPVAWFIAGGLLCILIGLIQKRKHLDEAE